MDARHLGRSDPSTPGTEHDEVEGVAQRVHVARLPLEPGEVLHAIRRNASWRAAPTEAGPAPARLADVYLTSHRLRLVGDITVEIALDEIREVALTAESLLVELIGNRGIALVVDRPRGFRANLAAARRAHRSVSEG